MKIESDYLKHQAVMLCFNFMSNRKLASPLYFNVKDVRRKSL